MSFTKRGWLVIAAVATAGTSAQLIPVTALADPNTGATGPEIDVGPTPGNQLLHNITYRARIDGVSRGATITYAAEGNQTQIANPAMVPGRTFEANTVLPGTGTANMRVSIEWPYSANLHCEILVDDAIAAQADDFIAPRVLPQHDDPDYGALTCEAPVAGQASVVPPDLNAPQPPAGPVAPPAEAPPPTA